MPLTSVFKFVNWITGNPTPIEDGVASAVTAPIQSSVTTAFNNFIKALTGGVFGASGASHSVGLVPDPGATPGNVKVLKEDATWSNPFAATMGMINGTIVEAHSSNNVTFSVKTLAGNDPSATDYVTFIFPTTTGTYTTRVVTSALSVTLNSGSTVGIGNAVRFTVYLAAFDNAGTVVLAAQQASSFIPGASGGIGLFGANQPFIQSTTAEGGGTATKSGNWYTSSALTTKSFTVIGWAEYVSGLAAAGTWNVSPDTLMLWSPGVSLPGLAGEVYWRDSTGKIVVKNLLNTGSNVADTNGTLNIDTLAAGFVPIYAKALILTVETGYSTAPAAPGGVVQIRVMADGYNLGAVLDLGKHQEVFVTAIGGLDIVANHYIMPIHPARRQFFYAIQSTDSATANKQAIVDCWGYTI